MVLNNSLVMDWPSNALSYLIHRGKHPHIKWALFEKYNGLSLQSIRKRKRFTIVIKGFVFNFDNGFIECQFLLVRSIINISVFRQFLSGCRDRRY